MLFECGSAILAAERLLAGVEGREFHKLRRRDTGAQGMTASRILGKIRHLELTGVTSVFPKWTPQLPETGHST